MMMNNVFRSFCFLAAGILALGSAAAQQAPLKVKNIRMIVPLPAGSAPDVIARRMAENLGKSLHVPVIVENKPGFSGVIGGQEVLRAPADGSTWYMSVSSFIAITPQTYSKLPYDPVRDFKPLVQVARTPLALAVSATGKFATLKDYLDEARKNPEGIVFASFGNGTSGHLLGEALMLSAQVKLRHAPYKQSASSDVIGGHIDATVTDVGSLLPFVGESPRLRILGVTGDQRDPQVPNVPTFKEQGYSSLENMGGWFGVFVPKATPANVAEQLSTAIMEATSSAQFKNSIATLGYQYTGVQGSQFADIVNSDYRRWGDVIRAMGGIRLD